MTRDRSAYHRCHKRGNGCEARCTPRCNGRNEQAHHRQLRNRTNTVDENLLAVCGHCHWAIHNPTPATADNYARNHGLLVPSWADYATTPVTAGCPITCTTNHTGAP